MEHKLFSNFIVTSDWKLDFDADDSYVSSAVSMEVNISNRSCVILTDKVRVSMTQIAYLICDMINRGEVNINNIFERSDNFADHRKYRICTKDNKFMIQFMNNSFADIKSEEIFKYYVSEDIDELLIAIDNMELKVKLDYLLALLIATKYINKKDGIVMSKPSVHFEPGEIKHEYVNPMTLLGWVDTNPFNDHFDIGEVGVVDIK